VIERVGRGGGGERDSGGGALSLQFGTAQNSPFLDLIYLSIGVFCCEWNV